MSSTERPTLVGLSDTQGAFSDRAPLRACRTHVVRGRKFRRAISLCCAISNQSHCKIGSKRVISRLCSALHQREMRNGAVRGYYAREPYEFSINSNPSTTSHEPSVTYPLVQMTTNVSNGTCSSMDQSLSYAPLGNRGVARTCELGRMLGSSCKRSSFGMTSAKNCRHQRL